MRAGGSRAAPPEPPPRPAPPLPRLGAQERGGGHPRVAAERKELLGIAREVGEADIPQRVSDDGRRPSGSRSPEHRDREQVETEARRRIEL
ncbi:hypothetical protein [Mesorhizobium japonicum]|uniref:hypothetical protein n=1 Tax=Mesorhizobium japonicum TaxID=2066070 RepID=UPI003B5C5A2B